jgi:hypothetical protein
MAPAGLWIGCLAAAGLTAAGLLSARPRPRVAALLLSLLLAPVLIAADNWGTERFVELRSSPAAIVAIAIALAAIVGSLAAVFARRPFAFAWLAIAALPFRIPVAVGGESSNLLVPLYLVIAAGLLASAYRVLVEGRGGSAPADSTPGVWLRRLLAAGVVLFALQAGYSDDFSGALEELAFFLVPFAALFVLLLELRWSPGLVRAVAAIALLEALVFATIGFWQYGTGELFWNEKVIAGNEVHAWFRVNSLFWDPNILGRYLAVTALGLAAAVAWSRRAGEALAAAAVAAVLLFAIALTFSQSSSIALVAGLVVLIALRWSLRWTVAGLVATVAVLVVAVLAGAPGTDFGSDSIEAETSGRSGLVSGGIDLAEDRPLTGHGSGSFPVVFRERFGGGAGVAVESHTEPITVAAEQGILGLLLYGAIIAVMIWALIAGARSLWPGLGGRPSPGGAGLLGDRWETAGAWTLGAARAAIVAAIVAMIVHSMAYAAFLSDPITWALLGAGLALARERTP